MRALVLFAILLGLLGVIYAALSGRHAHAIGEPDAPAATRSTADTLAVLAAHEDEADEDTARASFAHCLDVLRTRYTDADDRLGDMIYNGKSMLRKEGIRQALVDVATDLAEISPNPSSAKGSLANVVVGYVALRQRGNDRATAVSVATKLFITMGQLSQGVRDDLHREAIRQPSPATSSSESAAAAPRLAPDVPPASPTTSLRLDLKDKWHHAIAVSIDITKAGAEADLAKARLQVLAFTFDATFGREGQVDQLKDAIIAAIGEDVRDALAVGVDWKL